MLLVVSEGPDEEGGQGAGQQVPLTPAPPGRTNSVAGLSVQPVGDDVIGSWSKIQLMRSSRVWKILRRVDEIKPSVDQI